MKKLKITAAALSSAVMLAGCSAPALGEKVDPPQQYNTYSAVEVEPNFDPEANASWYGGFIDTLLSFEMTVDIKERVDNDTVKAGYFDLKNTRPDIFWLDSYYTTTITDGRRAVFYYLDGCDEESVPGMYAELEDAANELISQIPEGSSDYEKVVFVHDYIADNCVYDHSGAHEDYNGLWHTAYGCLVSKKAVCQGYAESFTYIMNLLGIESGVCQGETYGGGHAWNYVKLDGDYYWLDITWDDPDYFGDEPERLYFLMNDDMLGRTRYLDWDQAFAPVCTATALNPYVQDGAYFDSYDKDAVAEVFQKHKSEGKCSIMFSNYEAYSEAFMELVGGREIRKLPGVDIGDYSYIMHDRMYALDFEY